MDKTVNLMENNIHLLTMMTERIRDMTWPIGIEIRDFACRWHKGSGMIEFDVYFVLQPQYVPIEVQSIELYYSGNWFYGIDTVVSDEIPKFVGRQIDRAGLMGPHMVRFKIPEPPDRDTVIINPALVVDALDLPCIADLTAVELSRK